MEYQGPPPEPPRHRLPEERRGTTHHVEITFPVVVDDAIDIRRMNIYITTGLYPDGSLGEVFACIDRTGDAIRAMVDAWCLAVSRGLQSGVPLSWYVDKVIGTKAVYAAPGRTTNPNIPEVLSPMDYIARWLRHQYLHEEEETWTQ